jgi:hypothetical protein
MARTADSTDRFDSFIELLKRTIGGETETSLVRVTRASESSSFPSDFASDETVITLEMGTADVVALNSAFGAGRLNEMRITEIRLPGSRHTPSVLNPVSQAARLPRPCSPQLRDSASRRRSEDRILRRGEIGWRGPCPTQTAAGEVRGES